jgi:hypothetical protein
MGKIPLKKAHRRAQDCCQGEENTIALNGMVMRADWWFTDYMQ